MITLIVLLGWYLLSCTVNSSYLHHKVSMETFYAYGLLKFFYSNQGFKKNIFNLSLNYQININHIQLKKNVYDFF